MKEKHKSLERAIEKELAEFATKAESGQGMTPKAAEVIAALTQGLTFTKLLCILEEAKEKGLFEILEKMLSGSKQGKQSIGFNPSSSKSDPYTWPKLASAMKRIIPTMDAYNEDNMDSYEESNRTEWPTMRRGVPGTGPYANPRLRRRGGRKGIGRRAMADAMDLDNMDYNDVNMDVNDADMDYMDTMDISDVDANMRRGVPGTGRRGRTRSSADTRTENDLKQEIRNEMRNEMERQNEHQRQITEAYARGAADANKTQPHSNISPHSDTHLTATNPTHSMANRYAENAIGPGR